MNAYRIRALPSLIAMRQTATPYCIYAVMEIEKEPAIIIKDQQMLIQSLKK